MKVSSRRSTTYIYSLHSSRAGTGSGLDSTHLEVFLETCTQGLHPIFLGVAKLKGLKPDLLLLKKIPDPDLYSSNVKMPIMQLMLPHHHHHLVLHLSNLQRNEYYLHSCFSVVYLEAGSQLKLAAAASLILLCHCQSKVWSEKETKYYIQNSPQIKNMGL